MLIIKGKGKLYRINGMKEIFEADYELYSKASDENGEQEWWGSFGPGYRLFIPQGEYILEIQDSRKGTVLITEIDIRRGNYYYRFQGTGKINSIEGCDNVVGN